MEPAYTSISRGRDTKTWFIYTAEFCLAIKKDRIMTLQQCGCSWNTYVKQNKPNSKTRTECFLLYVASTFKMACMIYTNTCVLFYMLICCKTRNRIVRQKEETLGKGKQKEWNIHDKKAEKVLTADNQMEEMPLGSTGEGQQVRGANENKI